MRAQQATFLWRLDGQQANHQDYLYNPMKLTIITLDG